MPLVRPPSCIVKGGIPSSQTYLPTYVYYHGWRGWVPCVMCIALAFPTSPVVPQETFRGLWQ